MLEILRDKTMDDILMYFSDDDHQIVPSVEYLQLLVEKFGHWRFVHPNHDFIKVHKDFVFVKLRATV